MSREKLNAAATHFFNRILPSVTQKHLSDLVNPEVLIGAYRRHTGGPVQAFGKPITPEFMLKVSPTALPLQNGLPVLGDAAVGANAADQPLVWMRFGADAKVDDKATIQDLMGDLDTYTQRKFSLAGVDVELPEDVPQPPNSAAWAQTLQANRSAIPDNIATLTDVPAALQPVAPTVSSLQLILSHFFTYDTNGVYYARWTGGGRQIPQDLTDVYKQNNIRELKLGRDEMFVYMLAPKSLFTTQNAQAHDFQESVIRLEETGDPANPYMPTLIHSVYKRIDNTPAFHDFIFFESDDGLGLNIPPAVKQKMSSGLLNFLLAIPDIPEERAQFFHNSSRVVEGDPPRVQLTAIITGSVDLPAGAVSIEVETGKMLWVLCPIDKVVDLASNPKVSYLMASGARMKRSLNLVRPAIGFDAFRGKFAAAKQDGQGVIVGVIDSGIDANHAAFKDASGNSRIVAVWDQTDGAAGNPNSPHAKHPTTKAYDALIFGRERTGADVNGTTDDTEGHGTHVTGIAAGAEVAGASGLPRGIASQAKIVLVKTDFFLTSVEAGVAYIFAKATDLGMPCVINMSLGHHDHPHDGTDAHSVFMSNILRADAAGNYKKGRALVASAGNERDEQIHVHRDIATGKSTTIRVKTSQGSDDQSVTFWIRSSTPATKPDLRVTVRHPSGWTTSAITPTSTAKSMPVTGLNLKVVMTYADQNAANGDYNLVVRLKRQTGSTALPKEEWGIVIANLSPQIEVHGWALDGTEFQGLTPADNAVKIGAPAASRDVISVACTCSRLSWPNIDTGSNVKSGGGTTLGDLASFSSPGPLRTCSNRLLDVFFMTVDLTHPAIDTAAPGSAIQSALATSVPVTKAALAALGVPAAKQDALLKEIRKSMITNISWVMEGTSMASPAVAGLVACMLAAEPDLTQEDVRNRIRAAGRLPAPAATIFDKGAPDVNDWGPGLINAPALKP